MQSIKKVATFLSALRRAAKVYRVPYLAAVQRSAQLYTAGKFSLKEILAYGLFAPSLAEKFPVLISKQGSLAHLAQRNPPRNQAITESKEEFDQFCRAQGLPIPTTYGWTYQGRRHDTDGRLIEDDDEWQRYLDACLPADFIVKDRAGAYGSGFMACHRSGGKIRIAGVDQHFDLGPFIQRITPSGRPSDVLIQQRLFDAPALSRLSGRRGLQTMRVTTLLEDDGQVSVLFYMVKILAGKHDVDNFSMGTTGNLIAYGDRDNGILRGAVNIHPCGAGMIQVDAHPTTGIRFDGFQLPLWQEAIELAKRGQRCFPMLPTLGWDIALTEDGPKFLEANARWDPPLYAPFLMTDHDWHRMFGAR